MRSRKVFIPWSGASFFLRGRTLQPNQAGPRGAADLSPGLVHSLDVAQRAKHGAVALEASAKAKHPHALALLAAHLANAGETTVSSRTLNFAPQKSKWTIQPAV